MAVNLGKSIDDLTKKEPLEEGYYVARITKVTEKAPNKAMREGGESAEGAGYNTILDLKLEDEDPLINGRYFRKYLVLPRESDKEMPGFQYQTMFEQRIADYLEVLAAFEGCEMNELDPENAEFRVGTKARIYIQTGVDFRSQEPVDEIAMNMPILPLED